MDHHHSLDDTTSSGVTSKSSTHSNPCKLGEYREMISSMLQTYSLEQSLLQAASNVMHFDHRQISLKKYDLKVSC